MGEMLTLLVCVLGLASYASLAFVFPAGVLLKIAAFPGMGFTALASISSLSSLDAVSATEATAPEVNILTLAVVAVGVALASETVSKVKSNGRL